MGNRERSIVHLDADAFFASVEQAADPRLRGKPVAVGGEQRGIVASASYEARKFGVATPMPTSRARRLCPSLIVIPGDYAKYEQFSHWMFSYAYDFTPEVEITSIDEGYFDLTGTRKPPKEAAETIRRAIRDALKINVSEGLAANKLVSQIASKLYKPCAFTEIPSGTERDFLYPLRNRWLPGVGPRMQERMDSAGLTHIAQVAQTSAELLSLLAGSRAPQLREFANGIDHRNIIPVRAPAKSYSQQHTWKQDVTDEQLVEATVKSMADHLMAKVRRDHKTIRTLAVKVRYNDFDESQCSESLQEPTNVETDVYGRLTLLLRQAWRRRVSLRMVSVRLSGIYQDLVPAWLPLDTDLARQENQRKLAEALDEIRQDQGRSAILRGHDLVLRPPSPRRKHIRQVAPPAVPRKSARRSMAYIPLHTHSYYSFMDSTLSPAALVEKAAAMDVPVIALTDRGNLHGTVPFIQAAKQAGIRPVIGSEVLMDRKPLLLFAENAQGYTNLCRLLSTGSTFEQAAFEMETEGLIAVGSDTGLEPFFKDRYYIGAGHPGAFRHRTLPAHLPLAAVPGIHYAEPEDRHLHQVLESIRTLTLLEHPYPEKRRGLHHFPSRTAMARLFEEYPEAVDHTREIAERCTFDLPMHGLQFPNYTPPDGTSPAAFLRSLVSRGLKNRYPQTHRKVQGQVERELNMIHEVGYEEYFLVVWDLLQSCRHQGIPWITRGSAADSLVCYCLEISDICPIQFKLDFRRFLNRERMQMNKLPDIDIDFPHDARDHVVDMLFQRFGRQHTAVVGGFSTFKARSAFAEIAKVLGLSEFQVRKITRCIPHTHAKRLLEAVRERSENRELSLDEEPMKTAVELAGQLDGFPRYAKTHPCGVVLSRDPMDTLTPRFTSAKGYPTTHFDMDAVEDIGLVKLDILAQGGLSVLRDVRNMLAPRGIEVTRTAIRNWDNGEVWDLISGGNARAVHHIESPAMINLCQMCRVRDIHALTAVVSVIRPGAANEQKKQAFTRRYQGLEPVTYPHPMLKEWLEETFGLIVYEEQVIQICTGFADMNVGDADRVRRALVKNDVEGAQELGRIFYESARTCGHSDETIRAIWKFVCGFHGYAFCKAHSAAYAVEAFEAAWMKTYYPAEFMAAVLTHGKGFYPTLVYVLEAHRIGRQFLPPCVNHPGPGFSVEQGKIRVPVSAIKSLGHITRSRILEERRHGPFEDLESFCLRVKPQPEDTELLLKAGALDVFSTSRTSQFWEMQWMHRKHVREQTPWLLDTSYRRQKPSARLTEPGRIQKLKNEMELMGFTASDHPLALYEDLAWESYCPIRDLELHVGKTVTCCGLVLISRMHHQVTGELMKFLTIADWTGIVQTEFFAGVYQKYGLETVRYPVLEITAKVEPFDNGRGLTLRVLRAAKPRKRAFTGYDSSS